jgi:hypothetical protein
LQALRFSSQKSGEIAIWSHHKKKGDARLDFLFINLIKIQERRQTFDMGIVNEDDEKDTMLDF